MDVPATVRADRGRARDPRRARDGRCSASSTARTADRIARDVSISENWGFASFETDRYKLVVDEDLGLPCQLFDHHEDPDEDHDRLADPECAAVVSDLMDGLVRPFLATTPLRPHKNPFGG